MRKDPYAKEGYEYVFDYYTGRPIYYTLEEFAILKAEEEYKKKHERLHILEGLLIAFDNRDYIIKTISDSKNARMAKEKLMLDLQLSKKQASAILQMKLNKFVQIDRESIINEYNILNEELSDNNT